MAAWVARYDTAMREVVRPIIPPPPPFTKKFPAIQTLPDYSIPEYPQEWWDQWPSRPLPTKANSILNCEAFEAECTKAGVDCFLVEKVVTGLKEGARLGARGQGRTPARGENLRNFLELGERCMDTLATWLHEDPPFMAGPFNPDDPNGGDFRASPLQAQLKPNNCAR